MILGCILIKLNPEDDVEAIEEISKIKTKTMYGLFGEYDFLLVIEAETIEELRRLVMGKIRQINGVISTKTLIAWEPTSLY
jgi:DNA-binding Lrp family transcriptional regulator